MTDDAPDGDPPPLEEFDTFNAEDNYWLEDTTITVPRIVKASLDEHRDGQRWAHYLESLRRKAEDPLNLNDAQAIAEHVVENLDGNADEGEIGLAVADYLMTEYDLPAKVAEELRE